ncbi:putative transposon-derived protein F52C9.6 [Aphis craccivora]|uniref:Putative transposon-derived protein F52C9.6 n=1 Tax=Aphis craccivora TaxID=307492 RepID=A0A6G0ZKQ7_APHCR|nr:putative transposon-derived protein F52C9.6 [Aphis craccivora]
MIKINWIELKSNKIVLKPKGYIKKVSLKNNIMESKIKLIEHLIRHNDFLNNVFERRIMGRRRPRANYFHDIKEKMSCIPYQ